MSTTAFSAHIPDIEATLGYVFRDKRLLEQAFTRSSFAHELRDRTGDRRDSNEVLEFFGDSVLSCAIVTLLIPDVATRTPHGIHTELTEGDLSNIKSRLSDKGNLSESIRKLGLERFLLLGRGDEKLGIAKEPSVMEDLYESLLGAVYIDSGMSLSAAIGVVRRTLDLTRYLSAETPAVLHSAKGALQEFCADRHRRLPAPVYQTVRVEGPEHERIYTRACLIGGRTVATGEGKNQKLADAAAAEAALAVLRAEDATGTDAADERAATRLCAYAAERHLPPPDYTDLKDGGERERPPRFTVECRFLGHTVKGTGPSKRDAKRAAAHALLRLLGEV